jgi:hypothetical protein
MHLLGSIHHVPTSAPRRSSKMGAFNIHNQMVISSIDHTMLGVAIIDAILGLGLSYN